MNHAAASEYDTDLLIWIHQQVELLRAKKFDQLDIENLIDEVESIGIQFKIEFSDHLEMVMKYLLKCEYQAAHPPQKWKSLLWDHRCQMSDILEDMPSLENSFDEYCTEAYSYAVEQVTLEAKVARSKLPSANPYSKQQLFDLDYLPESRRLQ